MRNNLAAGDDVWCLFGLWVLDVHTTWTCPSRVPHTNHWKMRSRSTPWMVSTDMWVWPGRDNLVNSECEKKLAAGDVWCVFSYCICSRGKYYMDISRVVGNQEQSLIRSTVKCVTESSHWWYPRVCGVSGSGCGNFCQFWMWNYHFWRNNWQHVMPGDYLASEFMMQGHGHVQSAEESRREPPDH